MDDNEKNKLLKIGIRLIVSLLCSLGILFVTMLNKNAVYEVVLLRSMPVKFLYLTGLIIAGVCFDIVPVIVIYLISLLLYWHVHGTRIDEMRLKPTTKRMINYIKKLDAQKQENEVSDVNLYNKQLTVRDDVNIDDNIINDDDYDEEKQPLLNGIKEVAAAGIINLGKTVLDKSKETTTGKTICNIVNGVSEFIDEAKSIASKKEKHKNNDKNKNNDKDIDKNDNNEKVKITEFKKEKEIMRNRRRSFMKSPYVKCSNRRNSSNIRERRYSTNNIIDKVDNKIKGNDNYYIIDDKLFNKLMNKKSHSDSESTSDDIEDRKNDDRNMTDY